MITFVLAGNYREFRYWCRMHQINPNSRTVRYVYDEESLQGISGDFNLIEYGTCDRRRDYWRLYDVINHLKKLNEKAKED